MLNMNDKYLAKKIFDMSYIEGEFVLRSGVKANKYFDKYLFESDPEILKLIATRLLEKIPGDIEYLAGLELGGVPIAVVLSQLSGLPCRFIRKKAKGYGTDSVIEGGSVTDRNVLVIEDIVTSGGQVIDSVLELRRQKAIVTHVFCVIDREAGGEENLQKNNLKLHALFKISDLER